MSIDGLGGLPLEPEIFRQTRMDVLRNCGITVFIDGGANKGEFAQNIRNSGFGGKIESFEPASVEFTHLTQLSASDPLWDCHKIALGAAEGYAKLNLAGNSYSSSLLPMLDRHLMSAPDSKYGGEETVRIECLDNVCSELRPNTDRVYLKLDLQGYEMEALKGANNILKMTPAIELELALVTLYSGQTLCSEMIRYLAQFGFRLHYYENNFADSVTGEILELNGIFLR